MAALHGTILPQRVQRGPEGQGERGCHHAAIHVSEDKQAALEKAESVITKLNRMKLGQAAQKVRGESIEETLAYYDFPHAHWKRIRTNNPLERLMPVATRLRHIAGTRWGTKRYLNMDLRREMELEKKMAVA